MLLLKDNKYNREYCAPNTVQHFCSDFKTVLCKNQKFQQGQEIKDINVKNTYSWYSDLYKRLEMRTYVATIYKG